MRGKILRKIRSFIGYNNLVVFNNQKLIVDQLNKGNDVFLHPVPPEGCGGNIEHYFHFIFDLVYPLVQILNQVETNAKIYIYSFGVLSKFVHEIFGDRVRVISQNKQLNHVKVANLVGMHPACVSESIKQMDHFVDDMLSMLNLSRNPNPNKVLLIERMPPAAYFLKKAKIKGAGASRRSIKNHNELKRAIQKSIHPDFEFQNVRLEKMSFKEQVKAFNDATLVIGQHGAGLGNAVWMKDGGVVVELNWLSKPYFRDLCQKTNKIYLEKNYDEAHIKVDTKQFMDWLSGEKILNNKITNSLV